MGTEGDVEFSRQPHPEGAEAYHQRSL